MSFTSARPQPRHRLKLRLVSLCLLLSLSLLFMLGFRGKDAFARLKTLFPQTWILDPRPIAAQASIHGLTASGAPINDWMQLADLGKSERDYVIKPSGFSELAWGSRGVRVANDLPKEEWTETIAEALREYPKTPRILQRFHKGKRVRQSYFDRKADDVRTYDGRVRLCPYFFVAADEVQLGGILATIAPADKRLIHGMTDAVMTSCFLQTDSSSEA